MKYFKRMFLLLTSFVLMLGCASCGGDDTAQSSEPDSSEVASESSDGSETASSDAASSDISSVDRQVNIVPSENQNEDNFYTYNVDGDGIRVLFVGNSITKHAPKPDMGWYNDCGMAASSVDNDYVHILMKRILEIHPNASFAILQVADYEREFFYMEPKDYYKEARNFDADVVTMFFGANVQSNYETMPNPNKTFEKAYGDLRKWLDPDGDAFFIHSEGFYVREKLDEEKKKVSKKYGDVFISTADILARNDVYGQFNHPNDTGMLAIADNFWSVMEKEVKAYPEKHQ